MIFSNSGINPPDFDGDIPVSQGLQYSGNQLSISLVFSLRIELGVFSLLVCLSRENISSIGYTYICEWSER